MPAPRPRHDFTAEDIEALEDRLYQHNSAATGHADGRGLGFEYLDDAGRQIGAIAGHTWGGVAEIAQLWVDPSHRGRGLGLALLDAALDEARRRDCRQVFVQSYDFQAPELYEARGFERMIEAADWPLGHVHVLLRLRLA
ncbi:MAG TPA: GNAT family N-acetyltransferase [Caulobacteraceae bacterium]|jgi:ribosomal protein S18 acetylase RimI-like enzyme|nr:GNAT family N-acetyltransferase [Caulobacteraceae bacterium]